MPENLMSPEEAALRYALYQERHAIDPTSTPARDYPVCSHDGIKVYTIANGTYRHDADEASRLRMRGIASRRSGAEMAAELRGLTMGAAR